MYKALSQMAKEENFILLDVRTMEEYNDGHIPGAINIANESIGKEEILQLPDKNQRIYVYCRSGNRSKQAAKKLVKLGYTNIIEIGGIIDYHGDVEIN
jgi:rhodanese-related sulfurtransferase